MKRKGFTLIELLAIMATIAILSTILFPAFAKAREKSDQAVCMSNEKQLALGIMMYVQDYNGYYPPMYTFGNPTTFPGTYPSWGIGTPDCWCWEQLVYPYLKGTKVYQCPSSVYPLSGPPYGNYGGNDSVFGYTGISSSRALGIHKQSSFPSPANAYMFMDAPEYWLRWTLLQAAPGPWQFIPGQGSMAAYASVQVDSRVQADFKNGRHNGGLNVAYADGHVKFCRPEPIVQDVINAKSGVVSPWNPSGGI